MAQLIWKPDQGASWLGIWWMLFLFGRWLLCTYRVERESFSVPSKIISSRTELPPSDLIWSLHPPQRLLYANIVNLGGVMVSTHKCEVETDSQCTGFIIFSSKLFSKYSHLWWDLGLNFSPLEKKKNHLIFKMFQSLLILWYFLSKLILKINYLIWHFLYFSCYLIDLSKIKREINKAKMDLNVIPEEWIMDSNWKDIRIKLT